MARIGIIGLGRMGSAIAGRMVGPGREVCGWTRSGLSVQRAADIGITPMATLADLATASDVMISSLYDDAAVAEVLDALSALALTGKLFIDTSTITPATLTSRAEGLGAGLVDAPIAGGPEMVANGTCVIAFGCDEDLAKRASAALEPLTAKRQHVGPLGAGLTMKCINNSLSQVFFVGLCEQLRLAKRAGLPLDRVLDLIIAGHVSPPFLGARRDKVLGLDPKVGFPIEGLLKDNAVFQKIVSDQGGEPEGLEVAQALLEAAIADGQGEADLAALFSHAYHSA